jgi:AI-2 transport protein TqsA
LFAIAIGCWLIVWGFGSIAQWIIAHSSRLQSLYTHAADLLAARGLYAAELVAQRFNMSWILGVVRGVGASLQGIVTFALVTFSFVILGLLELEPLNVRLGQFGDGGFAAMAVETAAEIAGRLQTYMLVRFAMSVLTGLGFWGVTALYGLDLSREWGTIAFVLNFIPFIGTFVATLLPAIFAGAQYASFLRRL